MTTPKQHLRITHIAQVTGASGYYVRFSAIGQSVEAQVAWDLVKAFLKKEGVAHAKWTPDFNFQDGKKGAWWIEEETLFQYGDCFSNFSRAFSTRDTYSDISGYKPPTAQHTTQRSTQQTLVILPPHIWGNGS